MARSNRLPTFFISVQIRRLGRGRDRRSIADETWSADLPQVSREERILGRLAGKGLRKVEWILQSFGKFFFFVQCIQFHVISLKEPFLTAAMLS